MSTTLIIAAREYVQRIKQRGFIIGTILGVVLIVGLSFMLVIFSLLGRAFQTSIAILAPTPAVAKTVTKSLLNGDPQRYKLIVLPENTVNASLPASVNADLKVRKYDAALVSYFTKNGSLAFTYYPRQSQALSETTNVKQYLLRAVIVTSAGTRTHPGAENILNFPFNTVNLNQRYRSQAEQNNSQVLVYFLLLLMYMAVLLYGIYVGQGVIEEKSNRVMELMIGAVRPSELLAGKILGIGSLALTQLCVIGLFSIAISFLAAGSFGQQLAGRIQTHASAPAGLGILTVPLINWVYLLVFFLLGFFTYATLFAGVGALASKPEDVQQTSGIFTFPIIAAYLLSIFTLMDPDKPFLMWSSLVPMISPMVMFARISVADVPIWQVLTSIVLSLAAIWLFTLLAGKLYRIGVLLYGKPLSPKEVWRVIRART